MNTTKSRLSPLAVAAFSGLAAFNGANSVADTVLEEILVTAQKREQNLQDVGISVTAFSGDQIEKTGFH